MQCEVNSVQCAVCSLQCVVYSVQCVVFGVLCEVTKANISFSFFSFFLKNFAAINNCYT